MLNHLLTFCNLYTYKVMMLLCMCLSRLWSYLSKQAVTSANNCNFELGMDNEIENLNDKRNLLVVKAHHGDAHDVRVSIFSNVIINFHATIYIIHLLVYTKLTWTLQDSVCFMRTFLPNLSTAGQVNSKISVPETYHGLHKLDSTTGRNVPLRCISSTVIISPEKLSCDQCIWENQHHKVDMLYFQF